MTWDNIFLLLSLTCGLYAAALRLQALTRNVFVNPLVITVAILMLYLTFTGVSVEDYQKAGKFIDFWLQPAIVALAVPLYLAWGQIRKQWLPIAVSQLLGCVVGIVSVVLLAKGFGLSDLLAKSLAAKSVTTPIAMEVTSSLGGLPSVAAGAVIVTGIFGNICGFALMKLFQVRRPMSQGLSMGTSAHAIGVAAAMQRSPKFAAYASLGLVLNGILTALIAPFLVPPLLRCLA